MAPFRQFEGQIRPRHAVIYHALSRLTFACTKRKNAAQIVWVKDIFYNCLVFFSRGIFKGQDFFNLIRTMYIREGPVSGNQEATQIFI